MQQQYLTTDQYKQAVTQAQAQGIDPNQFLQTITQNGVVVQGYNDQQYGLGKDAAPVQQDVQQTQGIFDDPQASGIGNAIMTPLRGVTKGLLDFGSNAIKAVSGLFGAKYEGLTNWQQKNLTANSTAEKVFKGAGEMAPSIAAGVATAGLGAGAGLLGESAVQGATQFGAGYLGSGGDVKQAVAQGVLGAAAPGIGKYIISPTIDAVAPLLTRGGSGGYEALQGGIKSVDAFSKQAGEEFANGAKVLSQENPGTKLALNMDDLAKLSSVSNKVNLTEIPASGQLNPEEAQKLFTELNRGKNWFNPEIAPIYDNLRARASQSFGEHFDKLYENYATKINAVKALDDVFPRSGSSPLTASEQQALANKITQLAKDPIGKQALQDALQNFHQLGGEDLSSPAKAIAKANKIKSPVIKKALLGGLELLGLGKVAGIAAGIANHLGQ